MWFGCLTTTYLYQRITHGGINALLGNPGEDPKKAVKRIRKYFEKPLLEIRLGGTMGSHALRELAEREAHQEVVRNLLDAEIALKVALAKLKKEEK